MMDVKDYQNRYRFWDISRVYGREMLSQESYRSHQLTYLFIFYNYCAKYAIEEFEL